MTLEAGGRSRGEWRRRAGRWRWRSATRGGVGTGPLRNGERENGCSLPIGRRRWREAACSRTQGSDGQAAAAAAAAGPAQEERHRAGGSGQTQRSNARRPRSSGSRRAAADKWSNAAVKRRSRWWSNVMAAKRGGQTRRAGRRGCRESGGVDVGLQMGEGGWWVKPTQARAPGPRRRRMANSSDIPYI